MVESPIAESIEYRPPTQSQNSNMLVVSMPNSATFSAFVDTATKCLATALASPPRPWSDQSRALCALVIVSERGEGLRGDDEQGFRRIEIACRLGEIGAIDVGDKAKGHGAIAVIFERLIGHDRPEVGPADADVDDVTDSFAGVAFPLAAADAIGKVGHLVEHSVDLRHDVLAVDEDGRTFRRTERHMQDSAIFRDVDFVAAEHRVDPVAQPGLLGELDEQLEGFVVDAIFRVIEVDAGGLGGHPVAARRIIGEQFSQVQALHRPHGDLGAHAISRVCSSIA